MTPPSTSDEPKRVAWLPHTKLAPIALDNNALVRPRVLAALHRAICDSRLTLLSTPPGYGKSTLLNLWLQAASDWVNTDGAMEVAYLSLDATENDRTHFLLALIAALQTLHPACGQRAQTFLTQNGYPEFIDAATQTQILTGLIIIDIAQYLPQRIVLILDNYEQISEPTVHSALNYLLRRLPPQAHVVVSTTQDPPLSLAKMHAHGLATVFRAEMLAFDEVESTAFFDKVAALPLSPAQKHTLHHYTEGWPAGLRLLAQELHALPHETARTHFINSLDDKYEMPALYPAIEAYLREDAFDHLPWSLRNFLMQTSILSTLRADMCQIVTNCPNAAEILQTLYQRNLFLCRHSASQNGDGRVNDNYTQPSFRYHRLFAAFLRRQLYQEMPNQVAQLHRRAAEVELDPVQKIRHYLATQCWTEAEQLLSSLKTNSDWPTESLAKMAHNTKEMPNSLRLALTTRRRSAPPPAALRLGLPARQFEVLSLLDHGASNHDIATELFITLATVKEHIGEVMRKLDVHTRRDAVRRAAELGLLPR